MKELKQTMHSEIKIFVQVLLKKKENKDLIVSLKVEKIITQIEQVFLYLNKN